MIARVSRTLVLVLVLAALAWGGRYPLVWVRALQSHPEADATQASLVETARVVRGPFTLSITATGKLRARRTQTVRTEQMEGKLVWIAPDGAPIQKGAVIARLDDDEIKRQVRDIGLEYENARAEIEKAGRDRALEQRNSQAAVEKANEERRILAQSNEVQLKQAKAELDFRTAELERLTAEYTRKQRQADEKLIPREQLEEAGITKNSAAFAADKAAKDLALQEEKAKSAVEQKETELANARFTVQTAGRRIRDDAQAARLRLQDIQRRLDDAKQRLGWCTLRAPISGLVVLDKDWYFPEGRRVARPGDQLEPYKPLADLPDLSVMAIDCKVVEREISGVHLGQQVEVRLDERPEQLFHGRVAVLSSVASEVSGQDDSGFQPGTRVFTVTVELAEHDPKRLVPGMNATMEIITRRIEAAVSVPKTCVFERGAEHVVYVRRGGRFEAVPVELGEENDTHVRIRRGLAPLGAAPGGEWVATTDPTRKVENS